MGEFGPQFNPNDDANSIKNTEIKNYPSPEEKRLLGHNRLQRFINLYKEITGIPQSQEKISPEQRIEFIKNTDSRKFMKFLGDINSILRESKIEKWNQRAEPVAVTGYNEGYSYIYMEPPKNSELLFNNFYLDMQKNISPENINEWAAKLYLATVFAHMFNDGNGRTARHIYMLLRNGDLASQQNTLNRSKNVNLDEFCDGVSNVALYKVIRKEILQYFNAKNFNEIPDIQKISTSNLLCEEMDSTKIKTIRETEKRKTEYLPINNILQREGNDPQMMKWLAALRCGLITPYEGRIFLVSKLSDKRRAELEEYAKKENRKIVTITDQKTFDRQYEDVKQEWYKEITSNPDYDKENAKDNAWVLDKEFGLQETI